MMNQQYNRKGNDHSDEFIGGRNSGRKVSKNHLNLSKVSASNTKNGINPGWLKIHETPHHILHLCNHSVAGSRGTEESQHASCTCSGYGSLSRLAVNFWSKRVCKYFLT